MSSETASGRGPVPAAISVLGAGKRYRIYDRPQDRLKDAFLWRLGRSIGRDFWALREVSFEVVRGEAVGIIGRNGSGKSTLLQMIAGTLAPSEGGITVVGRVSALLELGSGFNPEFTGRENVYLGGAILGIPAHEMESRFAEIAAFADIGDFIEQPVKTYSSGMMARLAFSVAISVDPDVLIVDEILGVGDYGFQQKCAARLRRLRDAGLTLLFVSHSADAVKSLCSRALYLVKGRTEYWGSAETAVDRYFRDTRDEANARGLALGSADPTVAISTLPSSLRYGSGDVRFEAVEVREPSGEPRRVFPVGDPVEVRARIRAHRDAVDLNVSFLVRDATGVDLAGSTTFDEGVPVPALRAGEAAEVSFRFPNVFRPGELGISIAVTQVSQRDYSDNVVLEQLDGAAWFRSATAEGKPVHYKVRVPVEVGVGPARGTDPK